MVESIQHDLERTQDEIARVVVEKLKIELLGEAAAVPLVTPQTKSLRAYNLCLEGRHELQKWTQASLTRSLDYFTQALAEDPDYAQAHAGVAMAYVLLGDFSFTRPREVMPKAAEATRPALALDDEVAVAHAALACVLDDYEWDWPGAERAYLRALVLNAGDASTRCCYSGMLIKAGRGAAAFWYASGRLPGADLSRTVVPVTASA